MPKEHLLAQLAFGLTDGFSLRGPFVFLRAGLRLVSYERAVSFRVVEDKATTVCNNFRGPNIYGLLVCLEAYCRRNRLCLDRALHWFFDGNDTIPNTDLVFVGGNNVYSKNHDMLFFSCFNNFNSAFLVTLSVIIFIFFILKT